MPYGTFSEHGSVRFQLNLAGRVGDALQAVRRQLLASPGQSRYREGMSQNELITMLLLHWIEHPPEVEWVVTARDRSNARRVVVEGELPPFGLEPDQEGSPR